MTFWGRAVALGVAMWLVPFVVAMLIFPWRQSDRALFESMMSVTVTMSAVVLGLAYLRRVQREFVREGLALGLLWFVTCVLIDAPLMLFGGPMQMSVGAYMADIGVTYLGIPAVTVGLAVARSWSCPS